MDLHITLLAAAIAALINIWLAMRCGGIRMKEKVLHGDGGNALLGKRMRAHANFVEYTPFALILIGALEFTGHGGWPLALAAILFLAARLSHALGMDADTPTKPRMIGASLTMLILLLLAVAALLAGFRII